MEREHQKEPLLIQNTRQDGIIVVDVKQSVSRSSAIERTQVVEEVKKLLWLSGPLIFVSLLNYGLQVISIMFVGHLGELALSGASLATSFATALGFNLMVSDFTFTFVCSIELILMWVWNIYGLITCTNIHFQESSTTSDIFINKKCSFKFID